MTMTKRLGMNKINRFYSSIDFRFDNDILILSQDGVERSLGYKLEFDDWFYDKYESKIFIDDNIEDVVRAARKSVSFIVSFLSYLANK